MTELPRATASKNVGSKVDYAMGSTDRERQRLMVQGKILRGPLEAAVCEPKQRCSAHLPTDWPVMPTNQE